MAKFICDVCGYVYDEAHGDVHQNVDAGTSFEKLDPSWMCPLCAVGRDMFTPL